MTRFPAVQQLFLLAAQVSILDPDLRDLVSMLHASHGAVRLPKTRQLSAMALYRLGFLDVFNQEHGCYLVRLTDQGESLADALLDADIYSRPCSDR